MPETRKANWNTCLKEQTNSSEGIKKRRICTSTDMYIYACWKNLGCKKVPFSLKENHQNNLQSRLKDCTKWLWTPGLFGNRSGKADSFQRKASRPSSTPQPATIWTGTLDRRYDLGLGTSVPGMMQKERLAAQNIMQRGVDNHNLSSETQLFTERYIVEWLLQNYWAANGLPSIRRIMIPASISPRPPHPRRKRLAGQAHRQKCLLKSLCPFTPLERQWMFLLIHLWKNVQYAPSSLRDIKISIRPVVLALSHHCYGMLFALYKEEARHKNEGPLPNPL